MTSYAGATPRAYRDQQPPSFIRVAQSKLAARQARARGLEDDLEQARRRGRVHEVSDWALLLEGLYEEIEALDQQIAAYWHNRAWGGR